jgi:hypothetical protein
MSDEKTSGKLPEQATAMVPQPHGGALLVGGKQGHKGAGGRPPESLFRWAQLQQPQARRALLQILKDRKHPQRLRAAVTLLELAERGEQRLNQSMTSKAALDLLELFLFALEARCSSSVANAVLDEMMDQLERNGLFPELIEVSRFLQSRPDVRKP